MRMNFIKHRKFWKIGWHADTTPMYRAFATFFKGDTGDTRLTHFSGSTFRGKRWVVRGKSSPLLLKQAELAKIELNRLRGKLFNQIQGLRCKLLMNSRENSMLRAPLSVLRGRLSVQFSREFTSFACSADRISCRLTALLPLTTHLLPLKNVSALCHPCHPWKRLQTPCTSALCQRVNL